VHDGANIDFFFLNPKEMKAKFGGIVLSGPGIEECTVNRTDLC
jgi:hypothetical protein